MTKYFPYVLTPELAVRYQASLDEQQAILNIILEGTSENDMNSGTPMGTGAVYQFCTKAVDLAPKYPEYIGPRAHFTLLDFQNNRRFSDMWIKAANQRTSIASQVALITGLSDRGMTDKANFFHSKMESDKNVSEVKADYNDLHSMYSDRADAAKVTKENKALLNEAKSIIESKKKEA
jgi:hypothetical protein